MAKFSRSLGKANSARILQEGCERNLNVEIHKSISKHELFVAKSRLLACDEKYIYIDKPNSHGDENHEIEFGDEICVFLWHENSLLEFQTKVISRYVSISLNENKKITALSLVRPEELIPLQRRHEYRVKIIGSYGIKVDASSCVVEDELDNMSINNIPELAINGELVDLSISGAAVKLNNPRANKFLEGDRFIIRFVLKTTEQEEREFIMLATVCNRKVLDESGALRLGIRFEPWPTERRFYKDQEVLQRFITKVQREKLKRVG